MCEHKAEKATSTTENTGWRLSLSRAGICWKTAGSGIKPERENYCELSSQGKVETKFYKMVCDVSKRIKLVG